jgi:hypothetical protein
MNVISCCESHGRGQQPQEQQGQQHQQQQQAPSRCLVGSCCSRQAYQREWYVNCCL